MQQEIIQATKDGIRAIEQLLTQEALSFIEKVSYEIAQCIKDGGKLLIAGN